MATKDDGRKQVAVRISEETRIKLKTYTAASGTDIQQVLEAAIDAFIAKYESEHGAINNAKAGSDPFVPNAEKLA